MEIFYPLLFSFLITFATAPIIIRFARYFGLIDDPLRRTHPAILHESPVARGGGIPILVALVISSFMFLELNSAVLALFLGSAIVVYVGILDDKKPLSPLYRLVVNSIAGLAVLVVGTKIEFVTNPFGGIINLVQQPFLLQIPALFSGGNFEIPLLAWGITLIWIVFMTNIVSWSSGVDGQLAGFVPIAATAIGAISLRFSDDPSQQQVALLSLIVAGAYLGFLFWSAYPQRIMPGYSGGALAGFLLGVLAIMSGAKVATAVIILGIPVMDATFTILRRLASGKSPILPDTGHLHHRLLSLGWGKPIVALSYWIVTAILGFLVLYLNTQGKAYTIIMLAVVMGGILVWLTLRPLSNQQDRHTG